MGVLGGVRQAWARLRRGGRRTDFGCGLSDLCLSGWFNNDTRELFTGFPVGPGDTYLDVGCGDGGAALFAARMGCDVIATDVVPAKITALEQRLRGVGTGSHRCLVSDSAPLPLPAGVATRIACCEVMEHVPDPEAFLAELVRVGSAGALYLLTVPDPASEGVQREIAPECYWRPPHHLRVFAREEFKSLVERAGLTVIARHAVGFYVSVWWSLFWAAGQEADGPERPMLAAWTRAWSMLLASPQGPRIKQALDRALPKSQMIVARKAA